jgi:predicted dehydrogenase
MEYTSQSTIFKIKKVLRYITLYGFRRTWIKVRGQYHMKRKFITLPKSNTNLTNKQQIGIIGCGNYAFSNIAYYLNKKYGKVIVGCMDIDIHKAASLAQYYKIPFFTDQIEELLKLDNLKCVYIASNHASHAEYAIQCLERGMDVYIEKPHVVSENQLYRLVNTHKKSQNKIYLGFNRPGSKLGQIIQHYLAKESDPGMYNWFVTGHQIDPDHWYFKPSEGGRVLGNLCHWTDFLLQLVPSAKAYPIEIVPVSYKKRDSDIAVTYKFNEGTIGVITFSAKGHTFEGVGEKFNAHKGDCLISMSNFQKLSIDVLDKKKTYNTFYRDQGHKLNIIKPMQKDEVENESDHLKSMSYIWNTGWLFLKTREALETNKIIKINSFEIEYGQHKSEDKSKGINK